MVQTVSAISILTKILVFSVCDVIPKTSTHEWLYNLWQGLMVKIFSSIKSETMHNKEMW